MASFEKDNNKHLLKQSVARARRASQHAEQLVEALEAVQASAPARLRLEAQAYYCLIRGAGAFDRGRSSEALQLNCVARKLLGALAQSATTAKDEAFANSLIDAGEAQIRFSAYQLELDEQNLDVVEQGVADDEALDKWAPGSQALLQEVAKSAGKKAAGAEEQSAISWHGRTIRIRNPELIDAVAASERETSALQQALEQPAAAPSGEKRAKRPKKKAAAEGEQKEKKQRMKHSERNAKRKAGGARRIKTAGSKTSMDPFDRALSAVADAEALAAQLVEENSTALAKSHSSRYQAINNELKLAHEYLLYSLLSLRVRRNHHLALEVQRKADKREVRAVEAVQKRMAQSGAQRRQFLRKRQPHPAAPAKPKKEAKKPSASKATKARSKPKQFKRRPARGGVKRRNIAAASKRKARLQTLADEQGKRRQARAVPALAKLLDAAEASLQGIAALTMVEGEPDVSSLVDAKIAFYRAELLRQLAKAYRLSRAYPQAVLLVQRAQLFVRQARQALELASGVEKEDAEMPPHVTNDSLDEMDKTLAAALRTTHREMAAHVQNGGALVATATHATTLKGDAMGETAAAAALRELASKYVDFDPASLAVAQRIPDDISAEPEATPARAQPQKAAAPASKPQAPKAAAQTPDEETEAFEEADEGSEHDDDDFKDADAQDEDMSEDEGADQQQQQQQQKKGWFGGWLGRGGQ